MPAGRPKGSTEPITKEIAEQVLVWIGSGKTLRAFCRLPGMPHFTTLYDWLNKDDDFNLRFAHARDLGEDVIAQECLEIADDESKDVSGELEIPNNVAVNRAKLRIETRLKLLAKWNPKKYGERTVLAGDPDAPLSLVAETIAKARKRAGK